MSDTTIVESKPVYKTGESVGTIIQSNEAAASQPTPIQASQPVITSEAPVVNTTGATEASVPVINEITTIEPETNVSNFSMVSPEETPIVQEQAPVVATPTIQQTDWKDVISKVDRTELLKAAQVSDFALELDQHIKNGGDPADYLAAKAVDYNKIGDADLVKADMRKQYPNLSPSQVDLMFNRQYSVAEDSEQEDKDYAAARLQADAHIARQKNISEQQKFKIPTANTVQQNTVDTEKIAAEQQAQFESARKWYEEHDATKSLMTSKRVALDLGEHGKFNFNVDKPELLMRTITDGETWQRVTSNKQGEPDVALMQELALYATNPKQFRADLVNYGKSLALATLVKEGQNVTPPAKVIPVTGTGISEKEAWRTQAKSSTVGGNR